MLKLYNIYRRPVKGHGIYFTKCMNEQFIANNNVPFKNIKENK